MITSTISKWGNGQGLRIPKGFLDELGWGIGDKIVLINNGDGKVELVNESVSSGRIGVAKGMFLVPSKDDLKKMDEEILSEFEV